MEFSVKVDNFDNSRSWITKSGMTVSDIVQEGEIDKITLKNPHGPPRNTMSPEYIIYQKLDAESKERFERAKNDAQVINIIVHYKPNSDRRPLEVLDWNFT